MNPEFSNLDSDAHTSNTEVDISKTMGRFGPPDDLPCLHEYARWFAKHCPSRIAYTYLVDGESQAENLTFAELDESARAIAAELQQIGNVGDRVLLVYDTGLDFVKALVGCIYAGMVAVPTPPLDILRWDITLDRIERIARDANARAVLSLNEVLQRVTGASGLALAEKTIAIDQLDGVNADQWHSPKLELHDLAILQYTSGSTGMPRGVMVTQGNLFANFEAIAPYDEPDAVGVSWLPLHHDMGLMGGILPILQSGRRVVLMSPQQFVERPYRWLQAISRYRAYMSGGPNFAYELCVRKITAEERDALDLSCWTFAASGAERISADTLQRFADYFSPCGFRETTFTPCYGLAEMTLLVTMLKKQWTPTVQRFSKTALREGRAAVDDKDGISFVGCGTPVNGTDVKIVDPETETECSENRLGEIWMAGPTRAQGYWNNGVDSQRRFEAVLPGDDQTFYCRSGDQGFMFNGQLYVTGRLDDKIIVRGQNHYPEDLEATVEQSHACTIASRSVAFSVESQDTEKLVIVAEIRKPRSLDTDEVLQTIRASIALEHQLQCSSIVLVTAGSLPKTTSGKKQRYAVRQAYHENRLAKITAWQETAVSEGTSSRLQVSANGNGKPVATAPLTKERLLENVCAILANVCAVPAEDITASTLMLGELGMDSMQFMTFHEEVEQLVGSEIELADLMRSLSLQIKRDATVEQYVEFAWHMLGKQNKLPAN